MPIIGKVNALPPEYSLRTMPVGAKGYISYYLFIITKKAIFADLESPIVIALDEEEDDVDDESSKNYLSVHRIGSGLTEADYEVDFSTSDYADIVIEPMGAYYDLMKREHEYLIFTHFELGENNPNEVSSKISGDRLSELKAKLDKATEEQRFHDAAAIKKQIDELEKAKKNK